MFSILNKYYRLFKLYKLKKGIDGAFTTIKKVKKSNFFFIRVNLAEQINEALVSKNIEKGYVTE